MGEQHTYAMIKPGYEAYWGKVLDRISQEGLRIVRLKTFRMDAEFAAKFGSDTSGSRSIPTLPAT
jgi:nucleoside-diphosphate kinase